MHASGSKGFTLTEILIVVVIIAILITPGLMNAQKQIARSQDTKRKSDLLKIQKAFEEIFNDTGCYPAATILSDCKSTALKPYIPSRIPCDPKNVPYLYVQGAPSACSGYRLCAKLGDKKDTDIARIGCNKVGDCGFGAGYNYCVSTGYLPYQ